MSTNSSAASDDLEKGSLATVKEVEEEEEEKAIVLDPWKAKLVGLVMDALFGAYVLVFGGMMGYAIKYSTDWMQVLRCFMIILPFMLWNLCLIPQLKKLAVKVLAKKKPSAGSGNDDDLSTKLLASEK
ncbi:hypothetical protein EJB05_28746, partial [Eragrostis curvula]